MLGTRLPVSIYPTKSPIDMRRFNVPELDELLIFSVKDRYQLNYFICIKDFNAQTITSLIKFAFFVYLLMSAP
jgi:predicted subunit of tRNA(5-methylaminomethyl-2-thiouridylate) methyltransferase